MSTVINTNSIATRTANIYNRNNALMNGALTKLATGQRINSAKDNAANFAISERMRERIRANDQANQNSQNNAALLKTAQGGLDNTLDILNTLKERAINAANDSNVNSNRQAIVTEVQALVQQIDDNANKVKFNGRVLLNGAVDSSSGASSTNGVTATNPKGDKAVYSITGLKKAAATAGDAPTAVSADPKLVELVDNSGKSLFSVGDKVTLSWKANGSEISKVTTVASGTKLSDLGGFGFTGAWKAADATTGAKDGNLDDLKATAAGVYFVGGDTKTKITDVSISVSYTNPDGTTGSRTNAEAALKINGVQQSYGPAVGSNAVFAKTVSDFGTASATPISATGGMLSQLGVGVAAGANATLDIDGQKITINGNMTVAELNQALKDANINVRAQFAAKGETLKYDGIEVTRGTADDSGVVKSTTDGEFYFIGAAGVDISSIKVGTAEYKNPLKVSADASGTSGGSLLPQGNALTFFVGGEANFGVNFAIGKATVGNLLGSGASAFASRFATSEGAQSAIGLIDNAITKTLNEQARLGAMETRMGYVSDNLSTMNENLQAADSVLRDTDMAREMTNYMRYMVMSQASQYMLSQTGQNAFSVLNLLQP